MYPLFHGSVNVAFSVNIAFSVNVAFSSEYMLLFHMSVCLTVLFVFLLLFHLYEKSEAYYITLHAHAFRFVFR